MRARPALPVGYSPTQPLKFAYHQRRQEIIQIDYFTGKETRVRHASFRPMRSIP